MPLFRVSHRLQTDRFSSRSRWGNKHGKLSSQTVGLAWDQRLHALILGQAPSALSQLKSRIGNG
jgi:hypothetical protein